MTEKELHKLKRHDLLVLLVAQGKEAAELQEQLGQTQRALAEMTALSERLKTRLNEKDEQIERLKERLNEKDGQIERLKERLDGKDARIAILEKQIEELHTGRFYETESAASLREISYRLELMLRAAQKAANRYMEKVQAMPARGATTLKGSTGGS